MCTSFFSDWRNRVRTIRDVLGDESKKTVYDRKVRTLHFQIKNLQRSRTLGWSMLSLWSVWNYTSDGVVPVMNVQEKVVKRVQNERLQNIWRNVFNSMHKIGFFQKDKIEKHRRRLCISIHLSFYNDWIVFPTYRSLTNPGYGWCVLLRLLFK